jgi:hypothetical protein
MPEPIHPDNCAQPVALVARLHAETVSRPLCVQRSGDGAADPLRHGDPSAPATASHLREQQFARPVN